MNHLSAIQLRRAADIKDKLDSLHSELAQILGSTNGNGPTAKRRRMSAAAKARIAAAQRARWAKKRGAKPVKTGVKPRRKMSVAARKRMAQAAKERWVKAKAAGKNRL